MNFLLLMKNKHLPTNQDLSYRDNLVEQIAVDIRLYTLSDYVTITHFIIIIIIITIIIIIIIIIYNGSLNSSLPLLTFNFR